jgi:hypothetical protein
MVKPKTTVAALILALGFIGAVAAAYVSEFDGQEKEMSNILSGFERALEAKKFAKSDLGLISILMKFVMAKISELERKKPENTVEEQILHRGLRF